MSERIAVIGDGAMGTVCAALLANKGYQVGMWSYSPDQIADLREHHENRKFLPGIRLPLSIEFIADDSDIFRNSSLVVSAVPCVFLRQVWQRLAEHLPANSAVVSVTKGIEDNTLLRPTEIIEQVTGLKRLAVLSGPNIAGELARSLPATATVGAADENLAGQVQKSFTTKWFRIYTNPDAIGVELAGATKNVIAIAAGIIDGLAAGDNAKAALITRGMVEITRLGVAMGAQGATFAGLSGMGDLITTCISPVGRNRTFGHLIGSGKSVADALAEIPGQVEGVNTCRSVVKLAEKHQVEMPITQAVHRIIFEGKSVSDAVSELMTRRPKAETVN